MAYFPLITFNTPHGKIDYQAELDCSVNMTTWLLEDHDDYETIHDEKIAAAKADLINKYNIEEV